jgi:hypothetical protein
MQGEQKLDNDGAALQADAALVKQNPLLVLQDDAEIPGAPRLDAGVQAEPKSFEPRDHRGGAPAAKDSEHANNMMQADEASGPWSIVLEFLGPTDQMAMRGALDGYICNLFPDHLPVPDFFAVDPNSTLMESWVKETQWNVLPEELREPERFLFSTVKLQHGPPPQQCRLYGSTMVRVLGEGMQLTGCLFAELPSYVIIMQGPLMQIYSARDHIRARAVPNVSMSGMSGWAPLFEEFQLGIQSVPIPTSQFIHTPVSAATFARALSAQKRHIANLEASVRGLLAKLQTRAVKNVASL